jgi:MFS family permease
MERIGLTMGVLSVCVNLGFAAGPPVFGLLADLTGSFTVGLIVFGCVAGVASLTLLPVKPRYWTSPAARREGPAAAPAPVRPATAQ